MAFHMTGCGKKNKLCRNFWWEKAEKCVSYAENKLGYVEKSQQLTKLIILQCTCVTPSECTAQQLNNKHFKVLPMV